MWTKKELLKVLEQYQDNDVIVGELWSRIDVEYIIEQYKEDHEDYDLTKEVVENFDTETFWNGVKGELDELMGTSISHHNGWLDERIMAKLEKENA
jgi:hypothetical protein